jgi:hypothetical protein
LLNTAFPEIGRTGFYFMAGDIIVTFTGLGSQQKLNEDNVVQPVDGIILHTGKVANPQTYKAAGSCRFGNPWKGAVEISCHADTDKGLFEGVFVSNGQPPSR